VRIKRKIKENKRLCKEYIEEVCALKKSARGRGKSLGAHTHTHTHTQRQLKKRHEDEKNRLEQLYLKEQAGRRDDQVCELEKVS